MPINTKVAAVIKYLIGLIILAVGLAIGLAFPDIDQQIGYGETDLFKPNVLFRSLFLH